MQSPQIGEVWVDRMDGCHGPLVSYDNPTYSLATDGGPHTWTGAGLYDVGRHAATTDLVRRVKLASGELDPEVTVSPVAERGVGWPGRGAAPPAPDTDAPQLDALGATLAARHPYSELRRVLDLAYEQSAAGKGSDRHQNHAGERFEEQDIIAIPLRYGASLAGPAFQVEKKLREANRMLSRGEYAAAKREILGAVVYSVAAYLLTEKLEDRNK